jgi:hypothetical protein
MEWRGGSRGWSLPRLLERGKFDFFLNFTDEKRFEGAVGVALI